VLLMALLGSGRAAPIPASLLALVTSHPAVAAALPPGLPLRNFHVLETPRAGIEVPRAERLTQMGLQAAIAALALLGARFMPAETVGVVAAGDVLLPAFWQLAPRRDSTA
jgi:hypothetical protein